MKITMYELLGLVKDGKAPYKVEYENEIYIMDDLEYFYVNVETKKALFESIFDNYSDYVALNEKVEILDNLEEEKKIPEKIKIDNEDRIQALSTGNFIYKVNQPTKNIIYKINEIIDYLKSKGDE